MSIDDQLKKLATKGNKEVVDWAKQALDLKAKFESGMLSASEYKELLEDIGHSQAIKAAADDLEVKTTINECVEGMLSAANAVM
jgi:hypothetical protein